MPETPILVVEDERNVATAIKNELEQFGYSIAGIASNMSDAVNKTIDLKSDLVLLLKPYEERELRTTIEIALARRCAEVKNELAVRWLGAIFDGMDAAVIASDPDNRIHYMNTAGEALTGWRREDVVGAELASVCHLVQESGRGELESLAGRAVCESRRVPLPVDTFLATRDGRMTPINGYLCPLHDTQGDFLGMVFSFRSKASMHPESKVVQHGVEAPVDFARLAPPKTRGARPSILLADADMVLRESCRRALEQRGYRMLLADSGLQAIRLYQQQTERIDIVVMDLNLPDLTGQAVLQLLVEIDPGVRVLFSSAYFAKDLVQCDGDTLGIISKPYTPDDLVDTVCRELARHAGS